MGKNQVSLSTTGELGRILNKAQEVFPDVNGDPAELYRRICVGWMNDRQEGGKNKKLDQVIVRIEEVSKSVLAITVAVGQIEALLAALLKTVGEEHDLGKALEHRARKID